MNSSSAIAKNACPGCGADMAFNPSKGVLACAYCGHTEAPFAPATQLRQETLQEHSFEDFVNANKTQIAALSSTAQEVQCPGCGAEITFEPPATAGRCPFCSTAIVTQARAANPLIAPAGLVPFKVGRKQATQALRDWLAFRFDWRDLKALFLPGQLKQMAQQQGLVGVYLPFWTYDCSTLNAYRGERGTHYYVTEKDSEGNSRSARKTRWRSVSGQVSLSFDDVLVAATDKLFHARLRQIWPSVAVQDLKPYAQEYLAGFNAQRYSISLSDGFEVAKGYMDPEIRSRIRQDIGGDEQRIHQVSTTYSQKTFKHILLPAWLLSYRYRGKVYQVVVNAMSGKVTGDRPLCAWKVALAVAIAIPTALAIFYYLTQG